MFVASLKRIVSMWYCLAAYYHWNDAQCLEQAVLVAQKNDFDMNEIEEWSKREKALEKFYIFKDRI